MSTPTKAIPPLVGVDTYQSSISFGRCQHLVLTLGVDTYQSEYHLGRCQYLVLTLDVNTYLKGNAKWPTLPEFNSSTKTGKRSLVRRRWEFFEHASCLVMAKRPGKGTICTFPRQVP